MQLTVRLTMLSATIIEKLPSASVMMTLCPGVTMTAHPGRLSLSVASSTFPARVMRADAARQQQTVDIMMMNFRVTVFLWIYGCKITSPHQWPQYPKTMNLR